MLDRHLFWSGSSVTAVDRICIQRIFRDEAYRLIRIFIRKQTLEDLSHFKMRNIKLAQRDRSPTRGCYVEGQCMLGK